MKTKEKNRALEQAEAQLESIKEMVEALEASREGDVIDADTDVIDADTEEEARRAIEEDALSIEVRSGWYTPGDLDPKGNRAPDEYTILLCTGGPAVRIIGKLTDYCEPETARIEYQDWGTPWTQYRISTDDEETVLKYASCFYFGE